MPDVNTRKVECLYVPGEGRIEALLNPTTGLTQYGQQSLEEAQQDNPKVQRMLLDDAVNLCEKANRAKYCNGPQRITADEYEEMLEVLPPEDWTFAKGSSSFKMCERLTGTLTGIYIQVGAKHYTLTDDCFLSHARIMEKYGEAIESLEAKS